MIRVTEAEEAPAVVVVVDVRRVFSFPVCFNRPPAVMLTATYADWREQFRIKVRPGEREPGR